MKLNIPFQVIAFLISLIICVLLFGLDYKNSSLANYIYGNIESSFRIFELVPGDTGDAALNNWFLERNLQYLLKGENLLNFEEIFNAKIFWPEINTLAWSDNWILLTPLYGLIRLFASEGQSFSWLISICLSVSIPGFSSYLLQVVGSILCKIVLALVKIESPSPALFTGVILYSYDVFGNKDVLTDNLFGVNNEESP